MRINVERKVLAGLITVLLLMAGIGMNSYHSIRQSVDNTRRASEAGIARRNGRDILVSMLNLETGARGFVITGEDIYLGEYRKCLGEISARMATLSQCIDDSPEKHQWFIDLNRAVAAELVIVKREVELRGKDDVVAASLDVKTGDGKREMDKIRKLIAEFSAEQDALVSKQNSRGSQLARQTIWTIGIGSVCGFVFVAASCLLIHNDLARRRRAAEEGDNHTAALLLAHNELEARVRERTLELTQAGELIRASESRLRMVTDNARVGLVMVDRDRLYTFANGTYAEILGLASANIVGQRVADVLAPLYEDQIRPRLDRAFAGERVVYDLHSSVSGDTRHYTVKYEPSEVGGHVSLVVVVITDVTERKLAEDALRKSEAQLYTIVENIGEAVVVSDLEGQLLHFNRAALNAMGYASLEEGRRQMTQLVDTFELSSVDGTPWAVEQWPLARILRGEKLRDLEARMRRIGSEWERIFSFGGNLAYDPTGKPLMAVVTFSDITTRKQAEVSLREEEERFRTLANSIPQLAWIARADGSLSWYNDRWYEYTGTTPAEMEGWGWQCVHDPEVLPKVMENWKAAIESAQAFEMEFPLRGANGQYRNFLTRIHPLKDSEGRLVQWFGTNTDVDALKQAEETVRRLNTDLEQRVVERTAQLLIANNELESFSYSVSHDLRAPLRSLDGFSAALMEDYAGKLDAEGQDHLRRIRGASHRMGHLIEDLLNLSRMTRAELTRETVDLTKMAQELAEELHAAEPEREMIFVIAAGLTAQADPKLLRIALTNLFANAWKFTAKRVDARIEFACGGENEFFVRDNGAGFDMTYAGKLFGAFQRLHSMDEFAGTGIGLTIVHRIISRHGGRVWADGEVGAGATFHFTL